MLSEGVARRSACYPCRVQRIVQALLIRFFDDKPLESLIDWQSKAFSKMGLNRVEAQSTISEMRLDSLQIESGFVNGMDSEHAILFSAISLSQQKIEKILEIGTFQGQTTRLMATLFPNARIETIDLTHEDVIKQDIYAYGLPYRNREMQNISNVKFFEMNSLLLANKHDEYDLIWVDGNHKSPYTISDIVNALRLVADNGYIVCDDVYLRKPLFEKHVDTSIISIISALEAAGIVSYDLILKRLGKRFNNLIYGRKYIAVVRKSLRKS